MDDIEATAQSFTAQYVLGNVNKDMPSKVTDDGVHDEIRLLCPKPTILMGSIWDELSSKAQGVLKEIAMLWLKD